MRRTHASLDANHDYGIYEIRIKGQLNQEWSSWFGGMTVTLDKNGETILTGQVVDQAALHGLLRRIRDLGIPLLSVRSIKTDQDDVSSDDVSSDDVSSDVSDEQR